MTAESEIIILSNQLKRVIDELKANGLCPLTISFLKGEFAKAMAAGHVSGGIGFVTRLEAFKQIHDAIRQSPWPELADDFAKVIVYKIPTYNYDHIEIISPSRD